MEHSLLNRRQFLFSASALAGSWLASPVWAAASARVQTVEGFIRPADMGITLPHEHILVDFIGADQVSPDRYNFDEVFNAALPHLQQLRKLGCRTLIECTPAYLGRNAALLQRLAKASGLQMITNTGYYSAVDGKYLPAHAYTETAEQLAARWVKEWRYGIDGTGIKPGFIKISVDKAPLKDYNRKIVEAAALTHRKTGLTIASHTGNGEAALEQLAILKTHRVQGNAFVWVHAQNEKDPQMYREAAQQGAWIEFDGLNPENVNEYIRSVQLMKKMDRLKQVLLSHDAGWYHVGEAGGGNYRPYDTLFTQFFPQLRRSGFTDAEIDQLLIINPREAFTMKTRRA